MIYLMVPSPPSDSGTYLPHLLPGFLVNLSPGFVIIQRRTLPRPLVQGEDSQGGSDECECSALDYWQTTPNHGLEKSHYAGDKKYGGNYVAASWVIISEEENIFLLYVLN